MIQAYRLSELSRRYPSFIFAVDLPGWYVQFKNPASAAWWAEWRSPCWAGMRWSMTRWLLTLIDARRVTVIEAPPDALDVLDCALAEQVPGWAEAMTTVEATGAWSDPSWPDPLPSAGAPS